MRPAYFVALACYLAISGGLAHSQGVPIPFDKLEGGMQMLPVETARVSADVMGSGTSSSFIAATGMGATRPMPAYQPRMIDGRFLLINGAHLGMAMFDVAMTQHCMAEHQCSEGNPLMPSSQAGQISVDLGTVALAAVGAYWARKHNMRMWWMAPTVGIAAHTAGVATGFAHW